ncbi:WG repeat-containing protein [Candidatus Izemoplasma sp. B36]|uniref:WG repeat-containing protein n=1 Tax=Candidatus Izemoplasma sp. B36 TaxID=3242468 RepID=UPI003558AEF8
MKKTYILGFVLILSFLVSCGQTTTSIQITTTEEEGFTLKHMYAENYNLFHHGLLAVQNEDNLWGFVDESGQVVIDFIYQYATDFWDGVAAVGVDDLFGLIDTDGNYVLQPIYSKIQPLSNFNLFKVEDPTIQKEGLFNSFGEQILDFKYDTIYDYTFLITDTPIMLTRIGDLYGYTDLEGNEITGHIYTEGKPFSHGYAACSMDDQWGFIDEEGNTFIDFQFDHASSFNELGYAQVFNDHLGGLVFSDSTMIEPAYYYIHPSNDQGFAFATPDREGVYPIDVINIKEKALVTFNEADVWFNKFKAGYGTEFWANVAYVYGSDYNSRLYVDGEWIKPMGDYEFVEASGQVIIVQNDNQEYSAIDFDGHTIIDFTTDELRAFHPYMFNIDNSPYIYRYTTDSLDNHIVKLYDNQGNYLIEANHIEVEGNTFMTSQLDIDDIDYIVAKNDTYRIYDKSDFSYMELDHQLLSELRAYNIQITRDNYIFVSSFFSNDLVFDIDGNLILDGSYLEIGNTPKSYLNE